MCKRVIIVLFQKWACLNKNWKLLPADPSSKSGTPRTNVRAYERSRRELCSTSKVIADPSHPLEKQEDRILHIHRKKGRVVPILFSFLCIIWRLLFLLFLPFLISFQDPDWIILFSLFLSFLFFFGYHPAWEKLGIRIRRGHSRWESECFLE